MFCRGFGRGRWRCAHLKVPVLDSPEKQKGQQNGGDGAGACESEGNCEQQRAMR